MSQLLFLRTHASAPRDGPLVPPHFERFLRLERRDDHDPFAVTRHHREVARGHVSRKLTVLLDADADLHRRAADEVHPYQKAQVARDIGRTAEADVVDGRGDHARVPIEAAIVPESGFLGHRVEHLQQETEANVPANGRVSTTMKRRLRADRQPAAARW